MTKPSTNPRHPSLQPLTEKDILYCDEETLEIYDPLGTSFLNSRDSIVEWGGLFYLADAI